MLCRRDDMTSHMNSERGLVKSETIKFAQLQSKVDLNRLVAVKWSAVAVTSFFVRKIVIFQGKPVFGFCSMYVLIARKSDSDS